MYKILELLSLQRNGKPCMSITKGIKRWFLQRHAKSGSCKSNFSSAAIRHVDYEFGSGCRAGGSGAEVVTSEQRFAGKHIHIHIVFRPIFSIPFPLPSPTRCLPVFLPVLAPSETSSPNAFPQLPALARHIPTGQQPS